jgi:TRAP-type uncharacterized transport system substrate-binding protein
MAAAQQSAAINRGVVELETTGTAGVSVRIAEDLAKLIDDGATRRVVPVVGKGSLQNLTDLKFLHGIDVAIIQADVLEYAKEQRLFPGIESSVSYIAKLYNEEFHLLARPEIKGVADLANVDLRGSGTAITASRFFDLLKVPVTVANDSQEVALDKLRNGEIAALAFVSGKPAPLFTGLKKEDGLHFISVPFSQAAGGVYVPTRLTATDYPELVPQDRSVDTVAVGSVLAAADLRALSERQRNVANFVDTFFTNFQSLLGPGYHPKWQEVNIAAEFPGWRRYAAAEQWLQRNAQIASKQSPDDLRVMFARFVDERRRAVGGAPMSQQEKDVLFQQFQAWQSGQAK